MFDLVFTNARILIPGQGFSRARDLAVTDGKVSAIGPTASGAAKETIDLGGDILTTGLIDIHTHIYHKANAACVDPTVAATRSGATTLVDAGTAGAGSIHGYVDFVCKPSPIRLLAFLNISYAGIFGFNPAIRVGEAEDVRLLNGDLCIEAAEKFRDKVVGIKVRIGKGESGNNGTVALARALQAAQQLDLPLMAHIGLPPMDLDSLLHQLRPGDILTHCFRGAPNAPLVENDQTVRPSVLAARERGVLFDIGHGMGSFSFNSARAMLDADFLPDTISSDIHQFNIEGPVYDLLHTASKFLAIGVSIEDVIDRMTLRAATAIGRPKLGHLKVGSPADLTVISKTDGPRSFMDSEGKILVGSEFLSAKALYFGGNLIPA